MDQTTSLLTEDKDLDDAASMISQGPSVNFSFDRELLQTPRYREVYKDLYKRYKRETIASSQLSPRVSTMRSGNATGTAGTGMPPSALEQTVYQLPSGRLNTMVETLGAVPAPPPRAPPDIPAPAAEPGRQASLLRPPSQQPSSSRKRSISPANAPVDPFVAGLPFLGIRYEGETDLIPEDLFSDKSSSEGETSDKPSDGSIQRPELDPRADETDPAPRKLHPPNPQVESDREAVSDYDAEGVSLESALDRQLRALQQANSKEAIIQDFKSEPLQGVQGAAPDFTAAQRRSSLPRRVLYEVAMNDEDYGVSDHEDHEPSKPALIRDNKNETGFGSSAGNDGPASTSKMSDSQSTSAIITEISLPDNHDSVNEEVGGAELTLTEPEPLSRETSHTSSTESDSNALPLRLQAAVKAVRKENRRLAEIPQSSPGIGSIISDTLSLPKVTSKLDLPVITPNKSPFEIDFEARSGSASPMVLHDNASSGVPHRPYIPTPAPAPIFRPPARVAPPVPPNRPFHRNSHGSVPNTPSVEIVEPQGKKQSEGRRPPPPVPAPRSRHQRQTVSLSVLAKPLPTSPVINDASPNGAPTRAAPPPPQSAPLSSIASTQIARSTQASLRQSPEHHSDLIVASPQLVCSTDSSPKPEQARLTSPALGSPQTTISDDASTVSISIAPSRDSTSAQHDTSSLGSQTANTMLNAQQIQTAYANAESLAETGLTGGLAPILSGDNPQTQSIFKSLQRTKAKVKSPTKGLRSRVSRHHLSFLGSDGGTKQKLFHEYAKAGNKTALLEALQGNGKLVNGFQKLDNDKEALTPLMRAAARNHVDCMECLVLNGADYSLADKEGRIALHHASAAGSVDAVRFLTERFHSASPPTGQKGPLRAVDTEDHSGFRALHLAAGKGHIEVMQVLLQGGAKVEACDKFGRTPLYPALLGHHFEAFRLLLDCGANYNHFDFSMKNVLMWATESNAQKAVQLLLELGVDRHRKDSDGNQAIHFAAANGHVTILEMLYLSLEDLEVQNKYGERPMHLAAGANMVRVVKALLRVGCETMCFTSGRSKGAKVKSFKDLAATPLHYACAAGADSVAQDIVLHSADKSLQMVNAGQEDGTTPLMLAAQAGCFPITLLLLEHGANPNAKTVHEHMTALHYAVKAGDLESTQLLARNGAELRAKNKKKQTPGQYGTDDYTKTNAAYMFLHRTIWATNNKPGRLAPDSQQPRPSSAIQPQMTATPSFSSLGIYTGQPQTFAQPGNFVPHHPQSYYQSSSRTDGELEPPPAYTVRRQ